jgi:hypothetical protein
MLVALVFLPLELAWRKTIAVIEYTIDELSLNPTSFSFNLRRKEDKEEGNTGDRRF